jgi:hypothetical protein
MALFRTVKATALVVKIMAWIVAFRALKSVLGVLGQEK